MKEQQQLDFVRGEQLGMIRRCRLPATDPGDGRGVSEAAMKAVLYAIDSRAGSSGTYWASMDTLAADTGLSRRTIARALRALDLLRLLITTNRRIGRRWVTHRRICWPNLIDFCTVRHSDDVPDDDQDPEFGVQPAQFGVQPAQFGVQPAQFGVQPARVRSATVAPKEEQKRTEVKLQRDGDGVLQRDDGGKRLPPLQTDDLIDPSILARLWTACLKRKLLPDTSLWRTNFFALGHSIHRNREAFDSPVAMFWHKLRSGGNAVTDQIDDAQDRRWAKTVIDRMDGREPARPAAAGIDPEALAAREFEAERRRQMVALAAAERRGEFD